MHEGLSELGRTVNSRTKLRRGSDVAADMQSAQDFGHSCAPATSMRSWTTTACCWTRFPTCDHFGLSHCSDNHIVCACGEFFFLCNYSDSQSLLASLQVVPWCARDGALWRSPTVGSNGLVRDLSSNVISLRDQQAVSPQSIPLPPQLQTDGNAFAKKVQEQVQENPLKRGRFLREYFVPHTDETRAVDACQTVGDACRHCGKSHFGGSVQVSGIGGRGWNDTGQLDTQSFQCEQCSRQGRHAINAGSWSGLVRRDIVPGA